MLSPVFDPNDSGSGRPAVASRATWASATLVALKLAPDDLGFGRSAIATDPAPPGPAAPGLTTRGVQRQRRLCDSLSPTPRAIAVDVDTLEVGRDGSMHAEPGQSTTPGDLTEGLGVSGSFAPTWGVQRQRRLCDLGESTLSLTPRTIAVDVGSLEVGRDESMHAEPGQSTNPGDLAEGLGVSGSFAPSVAPLRSKPSSRLVLAGSFGIGDSLTAHRGLGCRRQFLLHQQLRLRSRCTPRAWASATVSPPSATSPPRPLPTEGLGVGDRFASSSSTSAAAAHRGLGRRRRTGAVVSFASSVGFASTAAAHRRLKCQRQIRAQQHGQQHVLILLLARTAE